MPGPRAAGLGLRIGALARGPYDAITDVPGVLVGHATLISGPAVRTGVTVVLPHPGSIFDRPVFAGCHVLNGNGEVTGLEWLRENGQLESPIAITNTHSVGVVRDALVAAELQASTGPDAWLLPVVGETYDGTLNDINGFHVRAEHVVEALAAASDGPVPEGNVGGGTGMICHGFKGGIGTASRRLPAELGGWTVGVLLQCNHGRRERLTICGTPVGQRVPATEIPVPVDSWTGEGSVIGVVATDAPLLPHHCRRLAQRVGLGIARTGGVGEHSSGDLFVAFSTGNELPRGGYAEPTPRTLTVQTVVGDHLTPLFEAVVDATEEAVVNALLAAETMTGRGGATAYGLDAERLRAALAG